MQEGCNAPGLSALYAQILSGGAQDCTVFGGAHSEMTQTMGDPVTQGQFFERMQQTDDKFIEAHRRLRESLEDAKKELIAKLDAHAEEDRTVADRVLVIETQRAEEAKQALRRGTWAGIIAGAGVSGLLAGLRAWWK